MDGAVVHTFGQPPRCEEFPEPAAGEGEAIVQVRAAGLPAAVLRSSGLEIYGSGAGTVPLDRIMEAVPQFMGWAVSAKLRIATEQVPLNNIEDAWQRPATGGRRLVIIP